MKLDELLRLIRIFTGDTNPGDCPYYDISPEIGITGTPAIDPVAGGRGF